MVGIRRGLRIDIARYVGLCLVEKEGSKERGVSVSSGLPYARQIIDMNTDY